MTDAEKSPRDARTSILSDERLEELKKQFEEIDRDDNGFIDREELARVLRERIVLDNAESPDAQELVRQFWSDEDILSKLDFSGDTNVSWNEFLLLAQKIELWSDEEVLQHANADDTALPLLAVFGLDTNTFFETKEGEAIRERLLDKFHIFKNQDELKSSDANSMFRVASTLDPQKRVDFMCFPSVYRFMTWVILLLHITGWLDMGVVPAITPEIAADFKISESKLGLVGAAYPLGTTFFVAVISTLYAPDAPNRLAPLKHETFRWVFWLTLVRGLVLVGTGFVEDYLTLVLLRALAGCGKAIFGVFIVQLMYSLEPDAPALWNGIAQGLISLSIGAGFIIGGYVSSIGVDWRWIFVIHGSVVIFTALLMLVGKNGFHRLEVLEIESIINQNPEDLKYENKVRTLYLSHDKFYTYLLLTAGMFSLMGSGVQYWLVLFFVNVPKVSKDDAAAASGGLLVVGAIVGAVCGGLYMNMKKLSQLGSLHFLHQITAGLAFFIIVTLIPFTDSIAQIYPGFFCTTACVMAHNVVVDDIPMRSLPKWVHAYANSRISIFRGIFGAIGPLFLGAVLQASGSDYRLSFAVVSAVSVVSILLLVFVLKRKLGTKNQRADRKLKRVTTDDEQMVQLISSLGPDSRSSTTTSHADPHAHPRKKKTISDRVLTMVGNSVAVTSAKYHFSHLSGDQENYFGSRAMEHLGLDIYFRPSVRTARLIWAAYDPMHSEFITPNKAHRFLSRLLLRWSQKAFLIMFDRPHGMTEQEEVDLIMDPATGVSLSMVETLLAINEHDGLSFHDVERILRSNYCDIPYATMRRFQKEFRSYDMQLTGKISAKDSLELAAHLFHRPQRAVSSDSKALIRIVKQFMSTEGITEVTFDQFVRFYGAEYNVFIEQAGVAAIGSIGVEDYEDRPLRCLSFVGFCLRPFFPLLAQTVCVDQSPLPQEDELLSFAQPHNNTPTRFLVDGESIFGAMADVIESAERELLMTFWWLTESTILRRTGKGYEERSRLDNMLLQKAKEGVKIYVLIWSEPVNVDQRSAVVRRRLESLHSNIKVIAHSKHEFYLWTHHQKFIVADRDNCVIGGLDITIGRFDDSKHSLFDDSGVKYPGIDYYNPGAGGRPHQISFLKPEHDHIARHQHQRFPWHDMAVQVRGLAAHDIAANFAERWNHHRSFLGLPPAKYNALHIDVTCSVEVKLDTGTSAIELESMPLKEAGQAHSSMVKSTSKQKTNVKLDKTLDRPVKVQQNEFSCRVQAIRSLGRWSGLSDPSRDREGSIYNAYITSIRAAKHFIYIENQFVMSSTATHGVYNEVIMECFYKVQHAIRNDGDFHVYIMMPLPDEIGETLLALLHFSYSTLSRGGSSLLELIAQELAKAGSQRPVSDFVSITSLRAYEAHNDRLVTEQIFVHSKLLIVDDTHCVLSSANVHDRSLLGNRDSEIGVYIIDHERIDFRGRRVGLAVMDLRLRLWCEYLRLEPPSRQELKEFLLNPSSEVGPDLSWKQFLSPEKEWSMWGKIATSNSQILEEVFPHIPTSRITTFEQQLRAQIRYSEAGPQQTHKLDGVRGFLVQHPINYLCNEDLTPSVSRVWRV